MGSIHKEEKVAFLNKASQTIPSRSSRPAIPSRKYFICPKLELCVPSCHIPTWYIPSWHIFQLEMDFQLGTEQKYWTCVLNLLRLTLLAPRVFVLTRSTKGRRVEMDPYYLKNNKCYRLEIF